MVQTRAAASPVLGRRLGNPAGLTYSGTGNLQSTSVRGRIQKFPDRVDNEINNKNNNKHSLRSNTKGYGGKTHQTDKQNSDTTAPNGRKLYHLQFSLQAASPETFGYILLYSVGGSHNLNTLIVNADLFLFYSTTELPTRMEKWRKSSMHS
jgi:hypothetical protein